MPEKRITQNIETQSVVGIILEIEQESYHLIELNLLPLAGAIQN